MKYLFMFIYLFNKNILINAVYPETTLECHSSLTKPDMKLICPEARSEYCVKEVVNLDQSLCGATQYFGDIYENNLCIYKKCSSTCVEGIYTFEYNGQSYDRQRYCCKTSYCNSSNKSIHLPYFISILCFLILFCFWL